MAFDSSTRNQLANLVTRCRGRLVEEFSDQFQQFYGIVPQEGSVAALETLTHLDESQRETARQLHEVIDYYAEGLTGTEPQRRQEAIDRLLREQAFTVLNRLAALRMAEERDIVQECVREGMKSQGFQLFAMNAGTDLGDAHARYVTYLECLYDELSLDLGVLFDRFSPHGLLFPGEAGLKEVLDFLGDADIKHLWAEDETIGWIYQYWNSKEERKAMRDASAAPRNSRELAVRNQFFTPRYVVEFLTDNTLGRIWYEMTKGQTRLAEQCRYLVRRPTEIFLGEGEDAPPSKEGPETDTEETLSQEELLKQPVHIPHRPVKDPREIRLLDPACGSMHFGLYAFDLFEAIYEEAWDKGLCPALQEAYPEKADYLRDVPRLIIEHNIHGVDIDPRAVQIAGLSLWLRAQKTWKDTPVAERPRVRRSNIVCAEPMPGSDAMLEDFVQTLDPPLLGELVKTVFDKMQLAGEAGTLLKIEEEIRTAIDDAKAKWEKLGAAERDLFSAEELNQTLRPGTQQEMTGVEKALTTDHRPLATDFFDTAEERIYAALRDYAESAEAGDYQRRLFAEDAAHGFAFIDLCRKRYDAVVMNPPFGACLESTKKLIFSTYGRERIELGGCFITRFTRRLSPDGKLGVIANRTLLFAASLEDWREDILRGTEALVDLGHGVLDALVETAAFTLSERPAKSSFLLGAIDEAEKGAHILLNVHKTASGDGNPELIRDISDFHALYGFPFAYWAPATLITRTGHLKRAEESGVVARQGLATCDNFRFLRLSWELQDCPTAWAPLVKGGEYQPFWSDVPLRVNWVNDGAEVKAYIEARHGQWSRVIQSTNLYRVPGATYSERTASSISIRVLPRGSIFDKVGPFVGAEDEQQSTDAAFQLIGLSYTAPYRFLIETAVGLRDATTSGSAARHYLPSMVQRLPLPDLSESELETLVSSCNEAVKASREIVTSEEPNTLWHGPLSLSECNSLEEFARSRFLQYCKNLERIYSSAETLESLAEKAFGITSMDRPALEKVAGKVVTRYPRETRLEADKLSELLNLPVDELIDLLVDSGKAHSTIYKKGYWGDRKIELIAHALEIHPSSILKEAKEGDTPRTWLSDTAWRVVSMAAGVVFGHITPKEFFCSAQDVLPDDVFSIEPIGRHRNGDGDNAPPSIFCEDQHSNADFARQIERSLNSLFNSPVTDEIVEILGGRTRSFHNLISQKFFDWHLSNYSDYRRQAPIYWPLSTESGTYTLWIYYHRLTSDTLYTAVSDFVEPKIAAVSRDLERLTAKGDQRTSIENREWEKLTDLSGELQVFRDELLRIANLPWKPNLNDGVQITAAPLWNLFRLKPWQKKLKDTSSKLEKGDYDWAHLALSLWPDRVIRKCTTDRSLAIAHGYEADLWEEVENDKGKMVWQPKDDADDIAEQLIADRNQ